jgi:uncharacterized protein (UPF0335 family)
MPMLPHSVEGKSAPFLARVENVLDQLNTLKRKYMAECKGLRADIKQIYDDAKDADVPVRALKGLVKYRQLEKKQAAIADTIAEDEVDEYQMLKEALGDFGDTELGQAALDLAGGGDDEDVRPRFAREDQTPETKPKRTRKAKADAPVESPVAGATAH